MTVPHRLPQDEALRRIKNLLSEMKTQYTDEIENLREEWDGHSGTFSFSVMGFDVSGTLLVKKNEVELCGNLPFAAIFFQEEIERAIREQAESLLT